MLNSGSLIRHIGLLTLLVFAAPAAGADDQSHYNRVNLSAEARADVSNDTLVAVLYAQREGGELASLAKAVNKIMSQAVERSKKAPGVTVQTLSYQTHPTYQNQQITGWRVRQSIQLKSRDFGTLSALIGDLQAELALESLSYMVSPEKRADVEERLIGEAIASFQKRARQITQHLGRSDFRLVTLDIRTGEPPMRPVPTRAAMMEARVAAPAIEPGTQTMAVNASGVIELLMD